MTNTSRKPLLSTRDMATTAVLGAIASVLFLFEIVVFPAVPFYKLDFSNLPVLLGTFAMGPVQGLLILAIKALLGLLHSTSGGVGELADFLMGAAMLLPVGLVYKCNKSRKTALLGMLLGTICAIIAAMLANYFILLPFFGVTEEALVSMGSKLFPQVTNTVSFVIIITGLFNLIKFLAISIVGFVIYKPLSPILHGRRKCKCTEANEH